MKQQEPNLVRQQEHLNHVINKSSAKTGSSGLGAGVAVAASSVKALKESHAQQTLHPGK